MLSPSDTGLPGLRGEGYTVAVETTDALVLRMSGNADLELLPRLGPFLKQLHGEVHRVGAPSVTVDIRELYFMNSSCLKAFITWIVTVSKADAHLRYRIRFLSNPNLRWQQKTLEAMKAFAPDLIDVQNGG
jgi:hypothetical protein